MRRYLRVDTPAAITAFEALDAAGQRSLHAGLEAVFSAHNQARDGSVELRAEYLDVLAVRR